MKLAFLGPAPPFRGGIVTYYAMLARVLEDRAQLFVLQGHQVAALQKDLAADASGAHFGGRRKRALFSQ